MTLMELLAVKTRRTPIIVYLPEEGRERTIYKMTSGGTVIHDELGGYYDSKVTSIDVGAFGHLYIWVRRDGL